MIAPGSGFRALLVVTLLGPEILAWYGRFLTGA